MLKRLALLFFFFCFCNYYCFAQATARFVGKDLATQGTWTGKYGADGSLLSGDAKTPPPYLSYNSSTQNLTGSAYWQWSAGTTDVRAPQVRGNTSARQASCWYSAAPFTFSANLTDAPKQHQVALYLLDWDGQGRTETITLTDAVSGAVLDTQTASSFHGGIYYIWQISGDVHFTFQTTVAPVNAVLSDVFFDTTAPSPPMLSVVSATVTLTGGPSPVTTHSVTLTWSAVSNAASYNVYRSLTSGSYAPSQKIATVTTPAYTDTSVVSGSKYFYVATSVNASGESAYSNEASAQIP
jgi:hypothetical protein